MQQLIGYLGVILITALFWGLIILYTYAGGGNSRSQEHDDIFPDASNSNKL
jgi:hypothetical protein